MFMLICLTVLLLSGFAFRGNSRQAFDPFNPDHRMNRQRKRNRYEEKTLAEKQLDFKRHLRTYLVMSAFFVLLDVLTGPGSWAMWPILGWGIGVTMQGLSLYGPLRDPDHAHPRTNDNLEPLPDLESRPEEMELKEFQTNSKPYSDDDLV